jgi:hypothetical protein
LTEREKNKTMASITKKQFVEIQKASTMLMAVIMERESVSKDTAEDMVVEILKEHEDLLHAGDSASVIRALQSLSKSW